MCFTPYKFICRIMYAVLICASKKSIHIDACMVDSTITDLTIAGCP
jgi:hypothetical protein